MHKSISLKYEPASEPLPIKGFDADRLFGVGEHGADSLLPRGHGHLESARAPVFTLALLLARIRDQHVS